MQFRAKLSPNSTFILDFIFECFAKGCLIVYTLSHVRGEQVQNL